MQKRTRIFILLLLGLISYSMTPALANMTMQIMQSVGILTQGTVFTNTYDTSTPAGSDAPSTIDNRIREDKAASQERNDVDHVWTFTGTQVSDANVGEHRKITYSGTISDPTQVAGTAHLFMQSDELRWQDDTNTAFNLTDAGTLNIIEADLLATLTNDTYFTAIDNAGTGTVDLIKADTNDVAVLPDDSQTATNAAPTFTASIANKKYVDDTAAMDPATYAGGETVTMSNGFIMKFGFIGRDDHNTTVTFGTAFPTGAVSCSAVAKFTSGNFLAREVRITSLNTTSMVIQFNTGGLSIDGYYWSAYGW